MTSVAVHDPVGLRRVFGAFPTGVTAVAALVDAVPTGIAASSFTSVSLDPALVSVCVSRGSSTWPKLRSSVRLGVSVLGAHHRDVARQLASREGDRFDGLSWTSTEFGGVLIDGASAWLDCGIEREIPAGDHELILLRVHRFGASPEIAPLVFHASGFHRLHAASPTNGAS
jgi:flavin reductase (DIM6/NTAB) family NADH-FMN oxidoreductase RutF